MSEKSQIIFLLDNTGGGGVLIIVACMMHSVKETENGNMKKQLKKVVSLLLAVTMLTGCNVNVSAPEGANAVKQYSMEEKVLPLYFDGIDKKEDLSVYFFNETGVPYISIDILPHLLEGIFEEDHGYEVSRDENAAVATITRKDSPYTAKFDFDADTITFFDYDAFLKYENDALVSFGGMSAFPFLFCPVNQLTNDRYGKEICFDLKQYDIDLVRTGDGYYLPLQTFSDLILSYCNAFSLYNGESVIITGGLDPDLSELYYSAKPERSEAFAKFDYNELCFALDHLYGLKDVHDIDSFDEFFDEVGIKKQ